ncbi:MAG: NADPH-dependent FMN reductase, partial [Rhodothermia bacterium]
METQNQSWPERHVALIIGSVRPNNFTMKAARIVADELIRQNIVVDLIDPAQMTLPLPGVDATTDDPRRLQAIIKEATGVVIATPEYHGSFSSVTKLVIENLGFPSVLAGKPVALMGVAAGAIGAIKSLEA